MNVPKPLDFHPEVIKKGTGKLLRYRELKREIRPLIIIVQNEPVSDLEKKLVLEESVNDEELLQSDTLISAAKKLREDLQPQVESLDKVAKELWEEAVGNWEELERLKDPSLEVTNGRLDIITVLKDLIRRQNHAKERRQELIVKHTLEIRDELMEMWKQCMVENSDDAGFPAFHRSDFTEQLLQIHKEELEKWKHFLAKHQLLFDQIEKRSNLWQRMRELQVKSEDPNRFINRGGSLLQTQKEQNYVTSALPKCEEKLKIMAKNFEKENSRKLRIQGMEIVDLIRKDWEEYRKDIKLRALSKHPVTRTSSRPEALPSGSRTGERHAAVFRENKINSAEKRRARETLANSPAVKKAKSCKNLTQDSVARRRRSST